MKSMVLGAKVALGSKKDGNPEHERRVESVKNLSSALVAFDRAVTRMKSVAREVVDTYELFTKAYQEFTVGEGVPDPYLNVVKDLERSLATLRSAALVDFTTHVDQNIIPPVAALKREQTECKNLENEREKCYNEYAVYKDAVEKKEAEYAKKGKDLTMSKAHAEESDKRDSAKQGVDAADEKYIPMYDSLMQKKFTVAFAAFSDICRSLATLYSTIASEATRLEQTASSIQFS